VRTSTHVSLAALILLMALAPWVCVSSASARVRQPNGRFVFSPFTKNHDPVSILQIGGSGDDDICRFQSGRLAGHTARTTRCFGSHLGSAWRYKGTEMKERNVPKCNGRDKILFKYPGGQKRAENLRSRSTHPRCKDQYHVRLWGDYAVNRDFPGEWSVATSYYEERGTCSFCDFETKGDHKVTKSWETVENRVMYELLTSTKGETRYCGNNDYRPVPGQRRGRDKRGLFNNGRISRLSVQKPSFVRPRGQECRGS